MNDLLLITFGWLLGLLAPIITTRILEGIKKKKLKEALIAEMQELQYLLLLTVFRIESKYGTIDHEFFKWGQSILKGYSGIKSTKQLIHATAELLKMDEGQMMKMYQLNYQSNAGSGLSLRKLSAPILDSALQELTKFSIDFRGNLLEIKTKLNFINEIAAEARYYFELTFQPGISPENHKIANANIESTYKTHSAQAKLVIELIKETLEKHQEVSEKSSKMS